jgi:hypothetical protein
MQLASIAAAAAIAWELGKEQIDRHSKELGEAQGNLAAARAQATTRSGSIEKNKAEADALQQRITEMREQNGGIGAFFDRIFEAFTSGPTGGGVAMGDMAGLPPEARAALDRGKRMSTPDSLSRRNAIDIAQAEQELKDKQAFIAKLENGQKTEQDVQANAKAIAQALKSGPPMAVNVANLPSPSGAPAGKAGPGGSRGPKKPAAMAPGGGY